MANAIFNTFKQRLLTGEFDFDTDTLMCALLSNSFTPDVDAQSVWSDISGDEATGTAYVAGGATMSGVTVTISLASDKAIVDATDITWASSTITARYAVVYRYDATPSLQWLFAAYDFGSDKSSSSGDFTIQWNASGLVDLT